MIQNQFIIKVKYAYNYSRLVYAEFLGRYQLIFQWPARTRMYIKQFILLFPMTVKLMIKYIQCVAPLLFSFQIFSRSLIYMSTELQLLTCNECCINHTLYNFNFANWEREIKASCVLIRNKKWEWRIGYWLVYGHWARQWLFQSKIHFEKWPIDCG